MAEVDQAPVALLGTGIMGAGMAQNIAKAGIPLRVWNRSRERAEPLAEHGATVTDTAAEAVDGADVVITMLFDAESVEAVMKDLTLSPDAVWLQMSTVGVEGTARLAELGGARFVDAPVMGTRQPAEQGTLLVLASGSRSLQAQVQPVLDAVGSRTAWVGDEPGAASRLKLVLNAWTLSVLAGTAQSVAFAQDLGVDPKVFLETISGGATDTPYTQIKGAAMIAGSFPPAFTLDGAAKDATLITEAMLDAGTDPSLMMTMKDLLRRSQTLGHGGEDMAAIYHAFR